MKHNQLHQGDLRKFIFQILPMDCFNEEQKLLGLRYRDRDTFEDTLSDVNKIQESRSRTSVSVNLHDGYKFRFLRKLDTEVKVTDEIEKIKK